MDEEFQGNEPQPGITVPSQMLTRTGHHVSGSGVVEPAAGNLVKFTSKSNGKEYAALRTGDAWYITGKRGKITWTEIVDEWAAGTIFVMHPLVVLHP